MIIEYFIGGGSDKNDNLSKVFGSTGVMEKVRQKRASSRSDIVTLYRGHEENDRILKEITDLLNKNGDLTVNLTGHSWGGAAAMDLTNSLEKVGIAINELITLDPVSMFPFFPLRNFRCWVNVYQTQSLLDYITGIPLAGNLIGGVFSTLASPLPSHTVNDVIATTGGQLGAQRNALNISCNLDHGNAIGMYIVARQKMDSLMANQSKWIVRD